MFPGGFSWDVSGTIGMHQSELFIHDTVNASLGPASPTAFDVGTNRQREINLQFDVSYAVTDMVHIGVRYRDVRGGAVQRIHALGLQRRVPLRAARLRLGKLTRRGIVLVSPGIPR